MAEAQIESKADIGTSNEDRGKRWRTELNIAARVERTWREDRAPAVVKRYRDEAERNDRRFNLLWSNTEVLKPAVYSQTPMPDVRRRYHDRDPIGRDAAIVIERALSFSMDDYDFDNVIENARDDMLLPGRGVLRLIYEPQFARIDLEPIVLEDETEVFMLDGALVEDPERDDKGAFVERKVDERVIAEYVSWDRFRVSPAKCWEDVRWIAIGHELTRDDLVEQFGDNGKKVPLDVKVKGANENEERDDAFMRGLVWEIWDKESRTRIWIADTGKTIILDEEDDPLGLRGFFPVPPPLYAVKTNGTMVPIPEYSQYQDQADEIDDITNRISKLIDACKVRGVYAGVIEKLPDVLEGDENKLYPIEDWEALVEKGGLEKAVAYLPIERIAQVLTVLFQQREALKREVFEITGLSDIIRGSTNPRETAAAQRIKSASSSQRMAPRQKPIQRFVRDTLRIKSEIIAEHFSADTLTRMTGIQVTEPIVDLLRDDQMRGFRIDIETDSTVQPDMEIERGQTVEFINAATGFIQNAGTIVDQAPEMAPAMFEMLRFASRRFKAGRQLEQVLEQSLEQLQARLLRPRQEGGQPDAVIRAQTDIETARIGAEADIQEARIKAQTELQVAQIDARLKLMLEQLGFRVDLKKAQIQANSQRTTQ